MNQELARLKKLRDEIVGIEMHLSMIQSDLIAVGRDVEFLDNFKTTIEENIKTLKEEAVIVSAPEFKKILVEYNTVVDNLAFYHGLETKLLRDLDKYNKMSKERIAEYELLKKNFEQTQTVLKFDLSKRKK